MIPTDRLLAALRGHRILHAYRGMRDGTGDYADLVDDLVAAMHRDGRDAYADLRAAADRIADTVADGVVADLTPLVILGPGPGARRVMDADGHWRNE
ncbi:MAG: hypothetical protein IPM64_17335 [Phycisphaerales bacterium]|nr:hypothetical protein [Phycisphaerales bacterium]